MPIIKACRIRCYPNEAQKKKIHQIMGACRYVHNLYLEYERKTYEKDNRFVSYFEFAKILTKLKKNEPDYAWLNEISTKAIKDTLKVADESFRRFFEKKGGFPKFKSRKRNPITSFFFIKDNVKYTEEPHVIKIPILHRIRITEKDYLPDRDSVTSGRVQYYHGKYYLILLYQIDDPKPEERVIKSEGIGLDLGIKEYATVFDGEKPIIMHSFLQDKKYKELSEKIQYYQRLISKKANINYQKLLQSYVVEPSEIIKNKLKGESYQHTSIVKLRKKIQKTFEKRSNYTRNLILSFIHSLVRAKPEFITIEDLNISKLLQKDASPTLHRHIQDSRWYFFITKLIEKCHEYQIEVRKADKFFASSKTCSQCGYKYKKLRLEDRTFICPECGLRADRDINAAINLRNTTKYQIA